MTQNNETLSDKILEGMGLELLNTDDVQEAIKKFLCYLYEGSMYDNDVCVHDVKEIRIKAREIFGDKLI